MTVEQLADGLWYWTAPHPEWTPEENWPEEVPCVYYEAADAIVLVDPLVPRGEEERFWRALDHDVERLGLPVRVLVTAPWHRRGTDDFVARYGATEGGDPPPGVDAVRADDKQTLFLIREHGLLVTGDVISGTGGGLHLFYDEPRKDEFLAWAPTLLELPFEYALIAHGEPAVRTRAEVEALF